MAKIVVSGLINVETTVKVDGFPVPYFPVRYPFFGVNVSVSGVGYNVAKALKALGDDVSLHALVAPDFTGRQVRAALAAEGLPADGIAEGATETPQSVILYDATGRRQVHVDLKDVQERPYPADVLERALSEADAAALCNINFSRPFLKSARDKGVLVATDVHVLSDPEDPYNKDFLEAADVLFLSDEGLPGTPEEFAKELVARYDPEVLVIGLGPRGALLSVPIDDFVGRFPAVRTRKVVSTVGAGDALFSSFLHGYANTKNPYESLRQAMVFASWKLGAASAAAGFLDAVGLEDLVGSPHETVPG